MICRQVGEVFCFFVDAKKSFDPKTPVERRGNLAEFYAESREKSQIGEIDKY